MSIDAVSSTSSAWATLATAGSQTQGSGPLASAAKALGLSQDDLMAALKSGKSLDDIAQQQGVSHDDLISAIKAGLPQQVAGSANADAIADKIAAHKGGGHHGGPPPPPPSTDSSSSTGLLSGTLSNGQQSLVDQLAGLLGTSSDQLVTQLQSGTSLSDLLSAQGISQTQLANTIQGSLYVDTTA